MPDNPRKKVILIAGMHRSGTSLLARLLNLHGAHLPLESVYEDEYNERGYWESFELQKLNDMLLQMGDSAWFDTRAFSLRRQPEKAIEEARLKLRAYAEQVLRATEHVCVIKDPRICRVIPYWIEAFSELGANVTALIPYRNPLEVAASIQHRDGFSPDFCIQLWLRYLLDAEKDTRGCERVFLSYSEMLGEWHRVFPSIQEKLNLRDLAPVSAIQDELSEFVSDTLRHWTNDDEELDRKLGKNSPANKAYRLLKRAVSADDEALRQSFDQLRAGLEEEAAPVAAEGGAALGASSEQQLHRISASIKRLDRMAQELANDQREAQAGLGRIASSALELEKSLNEHIRVLDEHRKNLASLSQHNRSLEADIRLVCREKSDLLQTMEALQNSWSWKLTAPLRLAIEWLLIRPARFIKALLAGGVEFAWRLLPGSGRSKDKLKRRLFTVFRFPLKYTKFYRDWIEYESRLAGSTFDTEDNRAASLIERELKGRVFVPRISPDSAAQQPVKVIAFYLPQFHPTPENNLWWGEGFTEWTNVKRAAPLYSGHYQPRIPGDLGYYDLRDTTTQRMQVQIAKEYGLGGFCFYFYWFNGTRLLEMPLLQYLNDPDLDLPFCLCWANENWTRTWDGLDSEVLIGQEHSKDDDLKFIEYISRYLREPRYIRVDGKPLLLVYRPSLLPDAAATARRWRKWCRKNGIGEIYLAYTQSFEQVDPRNYGFDAAIEFPPNNTGPDIVTHQVETLPRDFNGVIYDWTSVANRSRHYAKPAYTLFRGVNPGWDNTPRRGTTGAVFIGQTPERYQNWLTNAALDTLARFDNPSERLVFVNAWNEWAEGAYLEPDSANGYGYLEATRRALEAAAQTGRGRKFVLVAHDAHPHGAQYLVLYMAKALRKSFGFNVDLVVLGEGVLIPEFEKWATVHVLAGQDPLGPEAARLAEHFVESGHTAAICNTTVSGLFLATLSQAGLRCVSLVHELSNVIADNRLDRHAKSIAKHADVVVFAASQVKDAFCEIAPVPEEKIVLRWQGNYKKNEYVSANSIARTRLREQLSLPEKARIVLGVGYLDHRKGVDLFVEAGLQVCADHPDVFFVWIGHWEAQMEEQIQQRLARNELRERFMFPGRQTDTDLFYAGSDVFALTSREDPFPTTVMEALEVGVPVVGFKGAGGAENLLERGCGLLVPMESTPELAGAIERLLSNSTEAARLGGCGAELVKQEFSFRHYIYDLLELAGESQMRVSAVVPNYNYARHLEQRLTSIFEQNHPIYEVIVLDDASTDDSREIIENVLAKTDVDNRLVVNEVNSGSVFKQWRKGVDLARGDFVWICEADDFADPKFLERTLEKFTEPDIVLSYAQSKQVDAEGHLIDKDYLDYTNDVSEVKWKKDYVSEGKDELAEALCIKNTIPNVSAVVFRKDALRVALEKHNEQLQKLKVAGDWLIYGELLRTGRLAFVAESLNSHRRHDDSVAISPENRLKHMAEILFIQDWFANLSGLDELAREKAARFAAHAYQYLDLATPDVKEPSRHPGVIRCLAELHESQQ